MAKSPDAFRTISEVAEWLDKPAHVLRFWESKFTQVKPVKRAGGRRYYRPEDMLLLGGIKKLLHDDGMTIKGVQKILREQGVKQVAALSQPLDEVSQAAQSSETIEADTVPRPALADPSPAPAEPSPPPGDPVDMPAQRHETADAPPPAAAEKSGEPAQRETETPEEIAAPEEPPAVPRDASALPDAPPAAAGDDAPQPETADSDATAELTPPCPEQIDLPEVPPADQIDAAPGILTALLSRRAPLGAPARAKLAVARDDLARLRARLAQNAKE